MTYLLPYQQIANSIETEYVIGDDAAYAFLKQSLGTIHSANLIEFDPLTLVALSPEAVSGAPNLQLGPALEGAGVYVSSAASGGGFVGSERIVSPGALAGWVAAPGLHGSSEVALSSGIWANGQGNAQSANAARQSYLEMDKAAIAALRHFVPLAQQARKEYGGSICTKGEVPPKYFVGIPASGDEGHVFSAYCPANTTKVGLYHTHVGPNPDDYPNGQDAENVRIAQWTGYLGVSMDLDVHVAPAIQLVDCKPKKMGNIYRFTVKPQKVNNQPVLESMHIIACTPVIKMVY